MLSSLVQFAGVWWWWWCNPMYIYKERDFGLTPFVSSGGGGVTMKPSTRRRGLNPKQWAGLRPAVEARPPGPGRGRPGQSRPSFVKERMPCSRPGCDGVAEIRAKRSTPWPTCSPACRSAVWRDLQAERAARPTAVVEVTVVEHLLPKVDVEQGPPALPTLPAGAEADVPALTDKER